MPDSHTHVCANCGTNWQHSNGLEAEECEKCFMVDCPNCEEEDLYPSYREQEGRW